MFQKVHLGLSRRPLLVFDVREWYASRFVAGAARTVTMVDGTELRTIVRPDVTVTAVARPPATTAPGWPFAGPVELLLSRTPSGLFAFHGRVRIQEDSRRRGLVHRPVYRLPLHRTACRLQLSAPGYQLADLGEVLIPSPLDATRRQPVELLPGPGYRFASDQTVLRGGVVQPDGSGQSGVRVEVVGRPTLKPALTDALGQWVLVLDEEDSGAAVASPLDLLFHFPGRTVTVHGVGFTARADNRMPQTVIRGTVAGADGRPIADAAVTAAPFAGESRTRVDGSWQFHPKLDEPREGRRSVTVQVAAPGRPPAEITLEVDLGKPNTAPLITV